MTYDVVFAPLHGWLPYLSAGWTFANHIAQPMPGSHGAWSVCLEREVPA